MTLPKPYFKSKNIIIYHGDCLEILPELPDEFFDMILCDLPYGTTACKWDTIIPFEPLWELYKRIVKDKVAIALFGSEPFSSALRMGNLKDYKYDWIWDKGRGFNFASVKYQPFKSHEIISIFSQKTHFYNPQKTEGKPYKMKQGRKGEVYGGDNEKEIWTENRGDRHPLSIQKFIRGRDVGSHPTQKPVALLEYLIKTYTLENQLVLDNCMGSGSTALACINTGRRFIGIEKEEEYCEIAVKRIKEALGK